MKKIIALILTALVALISWSALATEGDLRAADNLVPEGAVLLGAAKG